MVQGLKGSPPVAQPAIDSHITDATTGSTGGLLQTQKDQKNSAQEAQFGEVMKNLQTKYGAKAEKPREIKKTLGKDDFLRIMITQMKQQDPSTPFKAEQFAAQLAQFTSVEQLQNISQGMNKLGEANHPLERLGMANMIGKTVTVDRERFPHTEGQNDSLTFTLPVDAQNVKVEIYNLDGEKLFEKDMGAVKKGENSLPWDGTRANGLPVKSMGLIYKVDAKDASGSKINLDTKMTGSVLGISFEGKETVLLIGDPRNPTKVSMNNVVRIDSNSEMPASQMVPGAQSLSDAVKASQSSAQDPNKPNTSKMFTFEKGKGSSNLDESKLTQEQSDALMRYQVQQQAQSAQANAQARAQAQAQSQASANVAAQTRPQAQSEPQSQGWLNGLNNDSVKNNSNGASNLQKSSRQ